MMDLWNDFLNTDLKEQFIQEINGMLEEEFKKPAKKRDYDKIEELTQAYAELMGIEKQMETARNHCLSELKSKIKPQRKITRKMRVVFNIVSIAVILLVMNIITVSAFNMNLFSLIVNVYDQGFSIDSPLFAGKVSDDDVIALFAAPNDPYGMIAECAKYGIYPETPHYLPDNYVLTVCDYSDFESISKGVYFTFTNRYNDKQMISLDYYLYEDVKEVSNHKFTNSEHHLSEIKINDRPAILAEEKKDKRFTIVYPIDNLLISIDTFGVSEEELEKVIDSIR